MSRKSFLMIAVALGAVGCEGLVGVPEGPGSGTELASASGRAGAGDLANPSGESVTGKSDALDCTGGPRGTQAALRALTPAQYANSVRDLFDGAITPSSKFPQPSGAGHTGFSTDQGLNALSAGFAENLAAAAEETALQVIDKVSKLLPCAANANRACAEQFVDKYARRAFRRPLSDTERTALLSLYDGAMREHGKFPIAIGELTSALLQMPDFVYLPEVGSAEADGLRRLDNFELASRLSYLFWNSAPDDALLAAAQAGELATQEGLTRQAQRLIASPKFDDVVHQFVREWTHIRVYNASEKDPQQFPMFDATLASAIQEELDRFVTAAVRKGADGLSALLEGRETFVNGPLAALYGLPSDAKAAPDVWRTVELGPERAGLLTRAALLSGFAGDAVVSHVKRGKFVRKGLLCSVLGEPPANAAAMQPAYPANSTRRERSEILQKTSPCGGCHIQLDRIGLALDDFDAIGRHLGDPSIDVSGEILFGGDTTGTFQGSEELSEKLSNSETVRECVAKQWFRYGFGHLEEDSDSCAYGAMKTRLAQDGDLGAFFASVVSTDAFRYRKLTK